MPVDKVTKLWAGSSKSEQYLANRSDIPQVSSEMANSVSHYRRQVLGAEVEAGLFRDGSSRPSDTTLTSNSAIVASVGTPKYAQAVSHSGGGFQGTQGNVVKQMPEVYSPLWLNSNLSLPRDRATINAWCRSFFALNPFVHNAICLHSTYPISKLNIKCPNKNIENFFNEMIEEIDLMNICIQIAQEFWLLGEAFVYAELDESRGKWNRLNIQNPDYMIVNPTVVAGEPIIMLRPDENLKKIIFSNRPKDIEQKKKLPQHIVDSVRRGQNIPLENYHISYLSRKISPYELRGTGLPVCIFRQLMLFDQLRECHDDQTEVLTDKGFFKIFDLIKQNDSIQEISESKISNYLVGAEVDENNQISSILSLKDDVKIACLNSETNEIEYHRPNELHMSKYNGEMFHFKSKNYDIMVSPNHKMWVQKQEFVDGKRQWSDWYKEKAQFINSKNIYRFQGGITNWVGNNLNTVSVNNKEVDIKLFLKFLGYILSEGCLSQNCIDFCQKIDSDCLNDIKNTVIDFAQIFDKTVSQRIVSTKNYKKLGFKKQPSDRWNGRINDKFLMEYFISQVSSDGQATSAFKKIPLWVKSLNKDLLKILLNTLVLGDGSHLKNKKSQAWKYYTVSKVLSDDVQEIAFKCGYTPSISKRVLKSGKTEYCISWSDANYGKFPLINHNKNYPDKIKKVNYDGVVWCFEVPTGLFITRRNGNIAIQGNSKYVQSGNMINPMTIVKIGSADYKPTHADLEFWREQFAAASFDKDFKIFTHEGVSVERVGYGQGIYDISGDITQLIKEIYVGLQVPSVVIEGGGDTTYANGGVALDTLRQRYMSFRNLLSKWLTRKIFAPISKIQEFFDYSGGEKKLIVPEIDWNHMSIFDTGDYIQALIALSQGEDAAKRVSLHTLYRSLGLDYQDEMHKIRQENIQNAINLKEKEALQSMDLNTLRSLDDEDEIQESDNEAAKESPLPGQSSSPSIPGLDLNTPPPSLPAESPPTK